MQRPEQRPGDVPVELLADEGKVDQLHEHRLQLVADLLALMRSEGRKVRALLG